MIVNSNDAPPITGFTDAQKASPTVQAVKFGNMLFVSRRGPLDPKTKRVVDGGIEVQALRTLENLKAVLQAASASLADVVNVRVILRDVSDLPKFNEVFRQEIGAETVTRTCVGATPRRTGVNIEIDCVAMFD